MDALGGERPLNGVWGIAWLLHFGGECGLGGAGAQDIDHRAHFCGHLGVGEFADDGVAEACGFGPAVIVDGELELHAEVLAGTYDDPLCDFSQSLSFFTGPVTIQLLECSHRRLDIIARRQVEESGFELFTVLGASAHDPPVEIVDDMRIGI